MRASTRPSPTGVGSPLFEERFLVSFAAEGAVDQFGFLSEKKGFFTVVEKGLASETEVEFMDVGELG